MADEAHWCQEGGRIDLKVPSGQYLGLSSMEIFQAVFGRIRNLRGVSFPDPHGQLPGLVFSRFPAEAAIRVFEATDNLAVSFGIVANEAFVPIASDADQVIVGNHWFPIQVDAMSSARTWAEQAGASELAPLSIGALIALRTKPNRPAHLRDEITATSASLALKGTIANIEIPGLVADLYQYQADGIGFLRLIAGQGIGCVLADEMGLGKTLQVIALLQAERNAGRAPQLIVAPATLLENWRRELHKFAPTLSVNIHTGSERPGLAGYLNGIDVTVVSYDTAIRDEPMLACVAWNVIALDEAQNIKNPSALRTCAVKRLPRRVSIAVTGTPLENQVDDLWSLTDFALPGLLGTLADFQHEFANVVIDATRLGQLVAPIVLRRKVLEVAQDLPPKIEIPQALTMTHRLAHGYEELRKRVMAEYGPAGALVATGKLRMFCTHPSLVSAWEADPICEMPKYARLIEILDEVFSSDEKALIFSTYTGMADQFYSDLPQRYPRAFFRTIDGRLEVQHRQRTVDEFFAHHGSGALFLNPKAAGVGLNITAANHVIHYNPEWNPAMTDQATARAFRRKQERPVTVHHLYFVGTVEEVIIDRATFKRRLATEAVTGHEGDADPLSIARALSDLPTRGDRRAPFMTSEVRKRLSANDLGKTGAHQGGVVVPKESRVLSFFPSLDAKVKNPRMELVMKEGTGAARWEFQFIYYNGKFFGGTRNEYRLTCMTEYLRSSNAKIGDELVFSIDEDASYVVDIARSNSPEAISHKSGMLVLSGGWKVINFGK